MDEYEALFPRQDDDSSDEEDDEEDAAGIDAEGTREAREEDDTSGDGTRRDLVNKNAALKQRLLDINKTRWGEMHGAAPWKGDHRRLCSGGSGSCDTVTS